MTSQFEIDLLKILQEKSLPAIKAELERIEASADEGWKSALVDVALNMVETKGIAGFDAIRNLIAVIREGKAPDLSGLTLAEASEVLAILQREEADAKNSVTEFLNSLLASLVKVAEILVVTLIKEV